MRTERRLEASDAALARVKLLTLADSWRRVLANNAGHARPIVAAMMNGRVTITPTPEKENHWTLSGEGTLIGLFQRTLFPSGWRPQGDSTPSGHWIQPDICSIDPIECNGEPDVAGQSSGRALSRRRSA